jgi:hypothetical protein
MSRYRHREVLHMNIEPEKREGRQNERNTAERIKDF